MENRPCQANLMMFCDEITSLADKGNFSGAMYLDVCKAFDVAPRDIQTTKLALCNIKKAPVKWLPDRSQQVSGESASEISSGEAQRSI